MMKLQIKQINTQGQISIGKKNAGQKVPVKKYSDGPEVLTPLEIIPTFELELMKDPMFQNGLWSLKSGTRKTSLYKTILIN
jgi:hypothetical protein